jgi:hypothetical protein
LSAVERRSWDGFLKHAGWTCQTSSEAIVKSHLKAAPPELNAQEIFRICDIGVNTGAKESSATPCFMDGGN